MRIILGLIISLIAVNTYAQHKVILECYSGKNMILYRKINPNQIRIFKDGMIGIHEKHHNTAIFAECLIID